MPNGMKVVRPLPTPAVLSRQIRKRIKVNLTPLARKHAFFRQVLVANWQPQNMPKFKGQVTIGRADTISIDIIIINSGQRINDYSAVTVDDLWTWWSKTGTKKHIIRPVRAKFLRFQVDGDTVFALIVKHPGTRPNRKAKTALRKSNAQLTGAINPLLEKSVAEGMWK